MLRVGMKVVCIRQGTNPLWGGEQKPAVGSIYTIRGIYTEPTDGEMGLLFEEIKNKINPFNGIEFGFYATRFRPLIERKTDISFAHEILRKVTKQDRVRA